MPVGTGFDVELPRPLPNIGETYQLKGKAKMAARLEGPAKFESDVEATFPGIDDLSLMLGDDLTCQVE